MMPAAVDNESSLDAADALERSEDSSPLITVEGLSIEYFQGREWTGAVNDVSFSVNPGEVYGIVGESGCGKTTVLRSILGYRHPASRLRQGRITFRGQDVLEMSTGELRGLRGPSYRLRASEPRNVTDTEHAGWQSAGRKPAGSQHHGQPPRGAGTDHRPFRKGRAARAGQDSAQVSAPT